MLNVIVTATGFKVGSKGRVANTPDKAAVELSKLSKGEARKVRKMLYENGKVNLAAARRAA